jgi:hypothetical protein
MTFPAPGSVAMARTVVSVGLCMPAADRGTCIGWLWEGISLSHPGEMTRLEIVTGQRLAGWWWWVMEQRRRLVRSNPSLAALMPVSFSISGTWVDTKVPVSRRRGAAATFLAGAADGAMY